MAQTAVVVGVRSLGRVIAAHLGRDKWRVICAARTAETVQAAAAEVDRAGGQGVPVLCDLQDRGSLDALVREAGAVDLVIAAQTAGGRFGARPLVEIDDAELEAGFRAYVQGTWNLLKAVGPTLIGQKRGTFLQIGTSSGVRTRDGFAALGATQFGLRALVQVAAREWRTSGVHVAYLPVDGAIASERSAAWMDKNGADRAVSPDEIAKACLYLHGQEPRGWTHELVLRPPGTEWTAPT